LRYISLLNFNETGQVIAQISQYFDFSGWQPVAILETSATLDLFAAFLVTHEAYLVVFTGVQNLVEMYVVVCIT